MSGHYRNLAVGELRVGDVGEQHHSAAAPYLSYELLLEDFNAYLTLIFGELRHILLFIGVPVVSLEAEGNQADVGERVAAEYCCTV